MFSLNTFEADLLLKINAAMGGSVIQAVAGMLAVFGDKGLGFIFLGLALLIPKKTRRVGAHILAALAFSGLIVNLGIKPFVARMRPYDFSPLIPMPAERLSDFSFPSGHTSVAFATAFAIKNSAESKRAFVFSLIFAVLMGISRLILMVHYPTDVMAGALIGTLCGYLPSFVWNIIKKYGIMRK